MRHGVGGRKLGRPTDHRLLMYRNLVTDLLRYERIVTTEPKAKSVRPLAEKMITLAKEGGLHSRRQALAYLTDPAIGQKLFDILSRRYAERQGGYTRIVKLGPRLGDAARMAQLELVE